MGAAGADGGPVVAGVPTVVSDCLLLHPVANRIRRQASVTTRDEPSFHHLLTLITRSPLLPQDRVPHPLATALLLII